jgi:plastocyanin
VKMRLAALVMLMFVAMFSFAACSGGTEEVKTPATVTPDVVEVKLFNDKFEPAEVKIKVNGKVVIKNVGQQSYQLNTEPSVFNKQIVPDETFEHTFPTAATYKVIDVDGIGPAPTMTIIVEP